MAHRDDVPAIMAVVRASIDDLQRDFLQAAQIRASRTLVGIDTRLVDDRTYFAVECDSRIVGCGGWSRSAELFGGGESDGRDPMDTADVRAMYTHPDFVRRGVGRLILMRCEEAAAEGFSSLELMATMAGRLLCEAVGFVEVEDVVGDADGVDVPSVRMRKHNSSTGSVGGCAQSTDRCHGRTDQ